MNEIGEQRESNNGEVVVEFKLGRNECWGTILVSWRPTFVFERASPRTENFLCFFKQMASKLRFTHEIFGPHIVASKSRVSSRNVCE